MTYKNKKLDLYVSTDIESDGPIPGPFSMLSLGSACYTLEKELISTYDANFDFLEGAGQDPETMKWWSKNQKAYDHTRVNTLHPLLVMQNYDYWLKSLSEDYRLIFVGYPAGFDFNFVYWYLIYFLGHSPFSFSALDVKSYASAVLKTSYKDTYKRTFPSDWFDDLPHTHYALDDAIEQGAMAINMIRYNLGLSRL